MAKPARRPPEKIKAASRTFFVTTRTSEGKALLQTDRMADLFVDVLRCGMRDGKFKVHDFVMMRNHVHMLLTISGGMTIEKTMQLIKGAFSFRARKEFGIRDWIWQRGFSEGQVRDDASFQTYQQYICNNPLKAGMAETPEQYQHGSLYLRRLKSRPSAAD